jgi:Uma2 family endonuclease
VSDLPEGNDDSMGVLLDKPIAPGAQRVHAPEAGPTPQDEERAAFETRYLQLCELLPKDRVELVDGRIVVSRVPTAAHNQLVFRLLRLLMAVADERGWEIWNDITLFLGPQQDRYRPDLTVVPPKPRMWGADHIHGDQVLLVVEVVSPSSVTDDHSIKPAGCAAGGVPLYLVVDPFAATARLLSGADRDKGRYTHAVEVTLGEPLELPAPWEHNLDTATLTG